MDGCPSVATFDLSGCCTTCVSYKTTVYQEYTIYIQQGDSCENSGDKDLYRGILLYYHMILIYAVPIVITLVLYARVITVLIASIKTAKDMTGQVALRCISTCTAPKSWPYHDDVIKWNHFPHCWPFVREITRHRWIPLTKASDEELWCFLISGPENVYETPVIWDAIALIVTLL